MANISTNIHPLLNWHHPTKVYFGQSALLQLSKLIEDNFPSVKNVLIVTGKYHLKSNEYFNNSIINYSSFLSLLKSLFVGQNILITLIFLDGYPSSNPASPSGDQPT